MAEYTCEAVNPKITDVRTLILLLNSAEPTVLISALDGISKFAEIAAKNRTLLLNLGIIKPLIDLSRQKDKLIKKAAVVCIAAATEVADIHPDMKRRDLLEALVLVLNHEDNVEILDEAAFAIANVSKDFGNKAEIRKIGGIAALVKTLDINDPDVKKSAAMAICSLIDDFTNRSEIRYVKGLKAILDLLASEYPEVQEHAFKSLSKASEDSESVASFTDNNGMALLSKLVVNDDTLVKKQASFAIAKAAKLEKNQVFARENGVFNTLVTQLGSVDPIINASSAVAIAALAKTEANQMEFIKLGAVDLLFKHIQGEEKDPKRDALAALGSLCLNIKIRTKVRANPDNIALITKSISLECDPLTVANAVDCIATISEDSVNRTEIVKSGIIPLLVAVLESDDARVHSSVCLAIAVICQDVSLLSSTDLNVCRNAAYSLSVICQYEPNSISACSTGALEALLQLSKQAAKKSTKFAADALEKILNYRKLILTLEPTAKYWLLNHLTGTNCINDGFYDMGYAGSNLEHISNLPTLLELKSKPIDKKREALLVDCTLDTHLNSVINFLSEILPGNPAEAQIKIISLAVSKLMGGPIEQGVSQNYKFRISELKLQAASNVVLLGAVDQGTFYHRALLFKAICDKVGLKPCTLVRGEYNRAWNIVNVKHQTLSPKVVAKKERINSSKSKSVVGAQLPAQVVQPSVMDLKAIYLGTVDIEFDPFPDDEPTIVDLMHNPGKLLPLDSEDALAYKRI
ncbi:Armadillo repeat-containing protein 3 [Boothiomyces macroporosus]|uniref:Armadillo repeat-containing protein 3 n=1 Tax=Boothiomyces macroporosus TaxID=261099 RepID=A0AAD5Y3M8_9FUNG|nr:Armadillo repeat-containing protein 3 [Boothiomyces macroporosus]